MFVPRSFLERGSPGGTTAPFGWLGTVFWSVPVGARLTKSCCRGWDVQVPAGKTGLGDFHLLHQEQIPLPCFWGCLKARSPLSYTQGPADTSQIAIKQPHARHVPQTLSWLQSQALYVTPKCFASKSLMSGLGSLTNYLRGDFA